MTVVSAGSDTGAGTVFKLLVFFHVLCATGGFGALIYRSYVLDNARRRGFAAAAGALATFGQVAQIGEVLLYGAGVFGVAAAADGGDHTSLGRPWVAASLAIFVVMVGLLHGLVRPAERRFKAALLELAQAPAVAPPGRPPQLSQLDASYRRIAAGMGVFNILLVAVLYLMVFQP